MEEADTLLNSTLSAVMFAKRHPSSQTWSLRAMSARIPGLWD